MPGRQDYIYMFCQTVPASELAVIPQSGTQIWLLFASLAVPVDAVEHQVRRPGLRDRNNRRYSGLSWPAGDPAPYPAVYPAG
jgi:hypothetical protein